MSHTDSPRSSDQGLITNKNKLTVNDTLKYDQKWLNTLTKVPERELFTGHNLFQWSIYITRQRTARNLMNHLTEDSPKIKNPNYMKWIESETILHGWLLDSMIPDIADLLKFEPCCKLIWEAAHKRHSKKEDESKIYELVSSTYGIKQGQSSVLVCANELVAVWKELDHYRPPTPNSIDREYILRDRVYLFLLGLNSVSEAFKGQIFNRPTKVPLEDAITLAIHEESRLKLQNKISQVPDISSNSAFIGQSQEKKPQSYQPQKRTWKSQTHDPKDSLWCTHCKKKRRTKETWDIHGRPKNLGKSFVTYEEADQENTPASALDLHQLTDRLNYNLSELERIKSVIQYWNQGSSAPSSSPAIGATSVANIGKCLQ